MMPMAEIKYVLPEADLTTATITKTYPPIITK